MTPDNDNLPAPPAARILPILGRVDREGRLVLARPLAPATDGGAAAPPEPPREA